MRCTARQVKDAILYPVPGDGFVKVCGGARWPLVTSLGSVNPTMAVCGEKDPTTEVSFEAHKELVSLGYP